MFNFREKDFFLASPPSPARFFYVSAFRTAHKMENVRAM